MVKLENLHRQKLFNKDVNGHIICLQFMITYKKAFQDTDGILGKEEVD